MNDRLRWHSMYLGAFTALRIVNVAMASVLVGVTSSDDETIRAIEIMRDGKEGDRVYPALLWLRNQRKERT